MFVLLFALGQGQKVAEYTKRISRLHSRKGVSEEELDCTGKATVGGGQSFAWRS